MVRYIYSSIMPALFVHYTQNHKQALNRMTMHKMFTCRRPHRSIDLFSWSVYSRKHVIHTPLFTFLTMVWLWGLHFCAKKRVPQRLEEWIINAITMWMCVTMKLINKEQPMPRKKVRKKVEVRTFQRIRWKIHERFHLLWSIAPTSSLMTLLTMN